MFIHDLYARQRAAARASGARPDRPGPMVLGPAAGSRPGAAPVACGCERCSGRQEDRRAAGRGAAAGSQDDVLQQVSQVVLAVARQLSTRDVLQMIVRSARSLVNARYAALGVPDDHGSFAEFVVDGISERAAARRSGRCPASTACSACCCARASRCGLTTSAPIRASRAGRPLIPDMSDFIGIPIRDGRDVLGIIFAACKRDPGGFTERDEQLLGLFAVARGDRADQRPAVRARPGALGPGGARPAGQGAARRGVAEAVQHPGEGPAPPSARAAGSRPGRQRDAERGRAERRRPTPSFAR